MRITGVETVLYDYELSRPIGDVNIPTGMSRRTDLAVFIGTDEGPQGVAVASRLGAGAIPMLSEAVIGEDPLGHRGLWERMIRGSFKPGNEGATAIGIAAIDNALWDLRAKIAGVPLWRFLGALEPRVLAYASGLDGPLTDDELRAYYESMAARGVRAGKLKVGFGVETDLRRLAVMHEALGGDAAEPTLLVDANEFWSPKQAVRAMRALERRFDIAWCEEPVIRTDLDGLRDVSRAINAAVATGENLKDIHLFAALLRHGAADIVQVNPNMAGLTTCLRAAELAQAFDRPVSLMNSAGRYGAHLAAALPNHTMMEVLEAGRDATFTFDSTITDGWIILGDTPGAGITFDLEALERYRVDHPHLLNARLAAGRHPRAGVREHPDE
ncbi:MAG: mandelate racemase/muconate lactonizing enzyme family protein [Acidimicrobiia bacterium]|nr:mandelate racemase/muconate lactonizing enzyme family protein [Acidimicrobiia bacterium]